MPKGKKGFQKGNKVNKGKKNAELSPEAKIVKIYNRVAVERVFAECVSMDLKELKARAEQPNASVLEVAVAKILYEAARKGDEKKLTFVLERAVGPVAKQLEAKVEASGYMNMLQYIHDAEDEDTQTKQ